MNRQQIAVISRDLSLVVAFVLYIRTALIVYELAGLFWLIVGFLCATIGIFPIAIVATVQNAAWFDLSIVVGGIILFVVLNIIKESFTEPENEYFSSSNSELTQADYEIIRKDFSHLE